MNQQKLLWGAVGLLSVAVVVLMILLQQAGSGVPAAPNESVPADNPVIAKIGDENIRASDLAEALRHKYGAEQLGQMLDRRVIEMEAVERQLKPNAEDIDAELKRMQQGYENEEQFYRSMKEQLGMSKAELREDVYYKLTLEKIATADIRVTDQEVDAYMHDHPEEFKSHVQLHLRQIVNQTLDQAKRTAQLARSGEDFATLARDRSIDTSTSNEGGDLGWVDEDDPFLLPAIMQAAKGLKPGEVSDPVKVEDGYAVVYLAERKEQSRGNLVQIRNSVRKQLALQKAPPLKEVVSGLRKKRDTQILTPELRS